MEYKAATALAAIQNCIAKPIPVTVRFLLPSHPSEPSGRGQRFATTARASRRLYSAPPPFACDWRSAANEFDITASRVN